MNVSVLWRFISTDLWLVRTEQELNSCKVERQNYFNNHNNLLHALNVKYYVLLLKLLRGHNIFIISLLIILFMWKPDGFVQSFKHKAVLLLTFVHVVCKLPIVFIVRQSAVHWHGVLIVTSLSSQCFAQFQPSAAFTCRPNCQYSIRLSVPTVIFPTCQMQIYL
jgi:hypothetical protein